MRRDGLLAETRASIRYLRQGLELTLGAPFLFISIVFIFSAPALLAALVAWNIDPADASSIHIVLLNMMTTIVGAMVFMTAVGAHYRTEPIAFFTVVRRAIPWLPRYIWTNVHTSVLFWVPVSLLIVGHSWLTEQGVTAYIPAWLDVWGFALIVGSIAAYMHSRTLLAPYLAVHSDLPASLAAWESWRVSGYYQRKVFLTFVICSLPFALPVIMLFGGILLGHSVFMAPVNVQPHLLAVGIQFVRLTLIPAAYMLYHDLWDEEEVRWQIEGPPEPPASVAALMKLTAWLPAVGPFGRRNLAQPLSHVATG